MNFTSTAQSRPANQQSLIENIRGYLPLVTLALAIVVWGANWPIMKAGLSHVTPVWFSALRFGSGACCLFALQACRGGIRWPKRSDIPHIVSVGMLQMMAFTMLGAFAMTKLPAGRSAVLSYTTLIWVAPISILVFGEVASWTRIAGLAFGVIGVGFLVNPLSVDWANHEVVDANLMLLGAAICWAICILHLRYFRPTSSAFDLAPWQMLLATVVLVVAGRAIEGPFSGDLSPSFWAILVFVGPFATAFCFCAVNAASTRLAATTMSIAMLGVPVTGVAVSILLLGEYPSASLLLGTLIIAAGMVTTSLPVRSRNGK